MQTLEKREWTNADTEKDMDDAQTLAQCEETIRSGLKSFIAVGEALLIIKERRLYREKFDTFELYCEARWGFTRYQAYRNMFAAETAALLPIGNKPTSESQVRPLKKLVTEKERVDAFVEASSRAGGPPTAAKVAAVVAERNGKKPKAEKPNDALDTFFTVAPDVVIIPNDNTVPARVYLDAEHDNSKLILRVAELEERAAGTMYEIPESLWNRFQAIADKLPEPTGVIELLELLADTYEARMHIEGAASLEPDVAPGDPEVTPDAPVEEWDRSLGCARCSEYPCQCRNRVFKGDRFNKSNGRILVALGNQVDGYALVRVEGLEASASISVDELLTLERVPA